MFYAIDYDSRKVESKNQNDNLLQKYILNNNLELAVALISNEDELVLKFSLNEMNDVLTNLGCKTKYLVESKAADRIMKELVKQKIPTFTKKFGGTLLKRYKHERPKRKQLPKKKKTTKQAKITLQTIFRGFTRK